MLRVGRYLFKRAATDDEFEQIFCLNYRTFVEEIPQHGANSTGRLVDKFHRKSTYFVALRGGRVVGMVSAHGQPPFSVAQRLCDPSVLDRPGHRPVEIRLLAVDPGERTGSVLRGLLWSCFEHVRDHAYTDVFISAVSKRVEMYQRLGFEPLGPAVPSGTASFVPMGAAFGLIEARLCKLIRLWIRHLDRVSADEGCTASSQAYKTGADVGPTAVVQTGARQNLRRHTVCLLPGPVALAPSVRAAFQQPPIYHRDSEFIAHFENIRSVLCNLVGGRHVALLNGSGTLANDAIAAALAAERRTPIAQRESHGLILVNGEFGERLARQAVRFGLNARLLSWAWGQPSNLSEIEAALAQEPADSWVWGVHLETSTGVLNDLPALVRMARPRGIRVCADCISSLGAVPIDLHDVYLASSASGKSLGAYSGVALVFADATTLPKMEPSRVPSYLDIAAALSTVGPCYTFASPIVAAVEAALVEYATAELACARYERHAALGSYVRQNLRDLGLAPLTGEPHACSVVTTFVPPYDESSSTFVERCRSWGFAIGGQSSFLAKQRMVQIATMGAIEPEEITAFFQNLGRRLALPS